MRTQHPSPFDRLRVRNVVRSSLPLRLCDEFTFWSASVEPRSGWTVASASEPGEEAYASPISLSVAVKSGEPGCMYCEVIEKWPSPFTSMNSTGHPVARATSA